MSRSEIWKARRRAAEVEAEKNRQHPEPLSTFNKREKSGEVHPAFPKGEATLGAREKAARAMADWDNSDPFAYGRTYLHVAQGYLRSEEVVKEMSQRTLARRVAKVREVERAKAAEHQSK